MTGLSISQLPFEHFFNFAEVTDFVQRLAESAPSLVKLTSMGNSREGRPLHLLTITDFATGAPEDKPAYFIHGNIHAAELSGTHSALYTARELVADHKPGGILSHVTFYIVPRINPDGAEFVVNTCGVCRSRMDNSNKVANTLYQCDLDGNGLILSMRMEHPDGYFAKDPLEPRLLIPRTRETPGPYYKVLPEGMIYKWDGNENIAANGRSFDWNRNWSYDWRPEPEQWGAGDFPFSEPEMRAMAEFLYGHPNLFAVLGYHTGPNALLRPPSTGSDNDIESGDLQVMNRLAEIASECTGFPIIPVYKYHFNRVGHGDVNLRGHFHNFGYQHLGLFVHEFELGTLVNSAGTPTADIFNTRNQAEYDAVMRKVLSWWDKQEKREQIFHDWTPFEHPQLGKVEIGGFLSRHLYGPTLPELRTISRHTYEFTLKHSDFRPQITIEDVSAQDFGAGIWRVRARIANRGEFPTCVTNRGRSLGRFVIPRVEIALPEGVQLLSQEGHKKLGHLNGLTDSRSLEWFLKAPDHAKDLLNISVIAGAAGNTYKTISK